MLTTRFITQSSFFFEALCLLIISVSHSELIPTYLSFVHVFPINVRQGEKLPCFLSLSVSRLLVSCRAHVGITKTFYFSPHSEVLFKCHPNLGCIYSFYHCGLTLNFYARQAKPHNKRLLWEQQDKQQISLLFFLSQHHWSFVYLCHRVISRYLPFKQAELPKKKWYQNELPVSPGQTHHSAVPYSSTPFCFQLPRCRDSTYRSNDRVNKSDLGPQAESSESHSFTTLSSIWKRFFSNLNVTSLETYKCPKCLLKDTRQSYTHVSVHRTTFLLLSGRRDRISSAKVS